MKWISSKADERGGVFVSEFQSYGWGRLLNTIRERNVIGFTSFLMSVGNQSTWCIIGCQ